MANIGGINLPSVSEPLVDPATGQVTPSWYQNFFLMTLQRTGGPKGVFTSDVETIANQALNQSNSAQTQVNNVAVTANSALTTADEALISATTANASAALKTNNLSDLTNAATARANLHVPTIPITISYEVITNNLPRYVPIVQALTIPENFGGLQGYAGIMPAFAPIFKVHLIRGGTLETQIGLITFHPGSHQCTVSATPSISLLAGDVLAVISPSPSDPALGFVAITFSLLIA